MLQLLSSKARMWVCVGVLLWGWVVATVIKNIINFTELLCCHPPAALSTPLSSSPGSSSLIVYFSWSPHHWSLATPPTLYSPLCAIITPIVTLMNSRFQIPESRSNSPPGSTEQDPQYWQQMALLASQLFRQYHSVLQFYKRTLASSPYLRVRGDEAGSGSVIVLKDNGKKIQILAVRRWWCWAVMVQVGRYTDRDRTSSLLV